MHHRREEQLARRGFGHHLRLGARCKQRGDHRIDRAPLLRAERALQHRNRDAAPIAIGKRGIAESFLDRPAHQSAHERGNRRRDARRYQHPPVARRIDGADAHRTDHRVAADALGARLIHGRVETASEQRERQRMLCRDVDVLAAPIRGARAQRDQNRDRSVRAGVRVRLRNRDAQRNFTRRAGDEQKAGCRRQRQVRRRIVRLRPSAPKRRDRRVHDVGIPLADGLRIEAETHGRVLGQGFDQHVGAGEQLRDRHGVEVDIEHALTARIRAPMQIGVSAAPA